MWIEPAPLRMILGAQALESTLTTVRKRIASFEAQTARVGELALYVLDREGHSAACGHAAMR